MRSGEPTHVQRPSAPAATVPTALTRSASACTAAWTCLAGLMGRRALRLATRAGTLEAV